MGTYGLKGVIRNWDLGKLTTEQAVGQILLLIVDLHERLSEIERWTGRRWRQKGMDLSKDSEMLGEEG